MAVEDFLSKDNSFAVVGVSRNREKFGYKLWKTLLEKGYKVYGINPKAEEIDGVKIYPNLEELSREVGKPDVVILVVPPSISEGIIDDVARLGIKRVWFQPGSESEKALEKAKAYGIETVHGLCFVVDGLKTEFVV